MAKILKSAFRLSTNLYFLGNFMSTKSSLTCTALLLATLFLATPVQGFQTTIEHSTTNSLNANVYKSTFAYEPTTNTYLGAGISAYFYEQRTNSGGGPTSSFYADASGSEYYESGDWGLGTYSYFYRYFWGYADQASLSNMNAEGSFTVYGYEYSFDQATGIWNFENFGPETVTIQMTAKAEQPVRSRYGYCDSAIFPGGMYRYEVSSNGLGRDLETVNATVGGQNFPSYGEDAQWGQISKGHSRYHYSYRN